MAEIAQQLHQHLCANPTLRSQLRLGLWVAVALVLVALYAVGCTGLDTQARVTNAF